MPILSFFCQTFGSLLVLELNRSGVSNTTLHSCLSPYDFYCLPPGARSPGEPGQTYLFVWSGLHFSFLFFFFQLHLTLNTTSTAVSLPPSCCPLFPLCSKVSRWDKRESPEIYTDISSTTHSFRFLILVVNPFIVCRCCTQMFQNQTAEEQVPSCRAAEMMKKRTGGRAFAVSVWFTVISSAFSSCFFICLKLISQVFFHSNLSLLFTDHFITAPSVPNP